jgi:hypothetical protein
MLIKSSIINLIRSLTVFSSWSIRLGTGGVGTGVSTGVVFVDGLVEGFVDGLVGGVMDGSGVFWQTFSMGSVVSFVFESVAGIGLRFVRLGDEKFSYTLLLKK